MKEFKVVDSNIYEMKGSNGRFYHLGTIHQGLREYICMVDTFTQQCYIEEVTGGHLSFIEDDNLAFDLAKFCEQQKITDMRRMQVYREDH